MRALLSLGLLALLSACAAPYVGSTGPYLDSSGDLFSAPLDARIVDVHGDLLVRTSGPAYVAVFEIVPGQGVGLLYPAYRDESTFLPGGTQRLWVRQSRTYYSYFASPPHSAHGEMPRYLYMVASRAPLRLSRYLDSPGALRRTLGLSRFVGYNPYSLMDELNALVLPDVPENAWSSDVFVIWPEPRYRDRLADFDWIRVRCPDGRVVEGPTFYILGACNQGPPLTRQRPDTTATSADSVRVPGRTRPEPEGEGAARTGDDRTRLVAPGRAIIETLPEVERIRPEVERARPPEALVERRAGPGERPEVESRPRVEAPAPRIEQRPEPRSEPRVERPSPPPVERSSPPPARVESPPPPRVEASPRPAPRPVEEPPVR